ncbi:hypothetical protein D9615_003216 [Tricholomella constricta]|uniref:Uncharacterized protein n=1 Tax=Tricholomella constricta TaxID=117010 RepID=A0A8H5HJ37_9AGAR|nr:hypothetical protein D9615_003216 [Tricholomella constricta]
MSHPEGRRTQSLQNPEVWIAGDGPFKNQWRCTICKDTAWRDLRSAVRHEQIQKHQYALSFYRTRPSRSATDPPLAQSARYQENRTSRCTPGVLAQVMQQLHDPHLTAVAAPMPNSRGTMADVDIELDWTQISCDKLPQDNRMEVDDSSVAWAPEDPESQDSIAFGALRAHSSHHLNESVDSNWFPWDDKQTCLLDILKHLPRSTFSDSQMETILAVMEGLGVHHLPSIDDLKKVDEKQQAFCGIPTIQCQGKLGHTYFVNHLGSIVAQEKANPLIGPFVRHYPEDSGQHLEEPWQAKRWLEEIDPTLATPMIRVGQQDYYTFEPAKLVTGEIVVPERWFTRHINGEDIFFAKAFCVEIARDVNGANLGYIVIEHSRIEIVASDLQLSMPFLAQTFHSDGLPDPKKIIGSILQVGSGITPWMHTNPAAGNRYRLLAKGHRVLSYPIWLYCDDTSGNVSKKWNKHNSFLFTSAGLPRSMAHKETNIHFLCTSNIAPPLEMLDGIVDQLEESQEHGVWAWDAATREMVLLIIIVLAMLGDNPMQSELACHIGLKGKFFCRNCWVKGSDQSESPPTATHGQVTPAAANADSENASNRSDSSIGSRVSSRSSLSSGASDTAKPTSKKRPRKETMQQMVERATRFLGENPSRNRNETLGTLRSMFDDACQVGGKTRYGAAKTRSGLKDNVLEFFTNQIFNFRQKLRGSQDEKEKKVREMIEKEIPKDPFSPVWRIKGLDPHQDTPVEILHVILLGFVKYLWRDAISRLSSEQKEILISRLNSLDVSGLGFSRLSGQTLVQYSGSLTGRDFRAISQIAPFVLYDLVPEECFQTWVALSAAIPLIWQPVIERLSVHLAAMHDAIEHFLDCTARWTPRWFNKPKFHIIRHLMPHVQRFGPAILFATEGFEAFNAVVRNHSVHSNRLAPSRDIGRSMARHNRVRHVLSGGFFIPRVQANSMDKPYLPFSDNLRDWKTAGPAPRAFCQPRLTRRNVFADMLGFSIQSESRSPGDCDGVILQDVRYDSTKAGQLAVSHPFTSTLHDLRFSTYKSVFAQNGDVCSLTSFILVRCGGGVPMIARLLEILQLHGRGVHFDGCASMLLVEDYRVAGIAPVYGLPAIQKQSLVLVHNPKSILCSVNVQHNCAANHCDLSATEVIREERQMTDRTRRAVKHFSPHDIMLNTAQMRDALHVQHFRIPPQRLDRAKAILEGATRETNQQKAKEQLITGSSQNTGRGRGRGRGRGGTPLSRSVQSSSLSGSRS